MPYERLEQQDFAYQEQLALGFKSAIVASEGGSIFGSHLAAQIADRILLPVLASMLMLIGLRLIAW
jgi:hypothetical protein